MEFDAGLEKPRNGGRDLAPCGFIAFVLCVSDNEKWRLLAENASLPEYVTIIFCLIFLVQDVSFVSMNETVHIK